MASGLASGCERRCAERVAPEHTSWRTLALLRPGRDVVLINLSAGGALIESPTRLSPGARTELQLFGMPRQLIRGRLDRCRIAQLEPLRYEGAIVFDERLEMASARLTE